ncbi:MAG: glycosyltransferase family 1 protein [Nitrospiraceae bacterium]|nr:glycosyltransferase family 1 protein [Nitrospiraceae bacterium]
MKLTILTNILTPYRLPLFEAMRDRVQEFSVLLMAQREENRQWTMGAAPFHVEVLPGFHVRPWNADVAIHCNYGVGSALRRLNPDVVLNAGFAAANISAFGYCKLHRRKFVQWAHLSLQDGAHASAVRRQLRHWLIRYADGSIGESSHAREAFIHYGAPPDRAITATMPLDVVGLRRRVAEARLRRETSDRLAGLSKPVLLSIGQIIPRKGYQELFDLYERLLRTHPTASLLIAGDGRDRARYQEEARRRAWDNVHFAGFVQASDLPAYFAVSDAFIFHTLYDPFGLVLSEAMAAGVPAVSSVHAMATLDLVEDGVTGYRIDPRDPDASAAAVRRLLDLPEQRRTAMIDAAYARVLPCDSRASADRIVEFLQDCCSTQARTVMVSPRA